MTNNYKLLTFIICLKRLRVNSIILRQPKYKLSQKLLLHPTTFNKYLSQCIELGYISEVKNGWKVNKFVDILSDFCKKNEVSFNKHKVISRKATHFKDVNNELLDLFVVDNIISQQKYVINEKSDIIKIHKKIVGPTEHNVKITKKEYAKYCKYRNSCGVEKAFGVKKDIITSARHCSSTLGLSLKKANAVLNAGESFKRIINYLIVDGCNLFTIETLRAKYPKASIIPMPYINKVKVCYGSVLCEM